MSLENDLERLQPMLLRRAMLRDKIKGLEKETKELDGLIRPALTEYSKPYEHMGFVFQCEIVPGRETLDKKAMEADGIDLTRYTKIGAPFTKLTIKDA